MLKNAKIALFKNRFILFFCNGEYLLNTVSENSTIQKHENNIHFIGGCCGEKKINFTFRPLTTTMDHLKNGRT
jgi:hypothetical protein